MLSLPAFGGDFPYKLDLKKELAIGGTGAALFLSDLVIGEAFPKDSAEEHGIGRFDKDDLFFIDRIMMNSYSEGADNAGDLFSVLASLMPALLTLERSGSDIFTLAVMYGETVLISHSVKELFKSVVTRYRPFCYYGSTKKSLLDESDSSCSFISGHTSFAFTGASFLSSLYAALYPDGSSKYWVTGGSFALASAAGICRICAGKHFFTDVATGALWGTFIGWFVPWLHRDERGKDLPFSFFSGEGRPGLMIRL